MILVSDSGSTKTNWSIAKGEEIIFTKVTAGMNPYFQTEEYMRNTIRTELYPYICDYDISGIYFYGAGCAFPEKNIMVEKALRTFFPDAAVSVDSDLLGAAIALFGNKSGIACILGTGSNSCLFDGKKIAEQVSPLGYILGDEGSGAVLGRNFVGDCLKRQYPEHIVREFMERYSLSPAIILDKVYRQPFPNRFLASLSPFICEHIGEPAVRDMVYNSFSSFFRRNVMNYTGYNTLPVGFIGSVAFHYRDILAEAASSAGINIGTIEKGPMQGLVSYINSLSK